MTCEEVERSIPFFLDDELETDLSLEVEAHVGACEQCRAVLQREGLLRVTLRRATMSLAAPASLRRSVRQSIERERAVQSPSAWRLVPATAAAVVLMVLVWHGGGSGRAGVDLEAAAERHARDLPMDVIAGNVSQVQEYFNGKLPFAVRLPEVPQPLLKSLGGRVTHLRDRDAAYVRYDMPRGRVSVFVYEDTDDDSEVAPLYVVGNRRMLVKQVRGYTVAKWRQAGLTYSMVTDLPEHELQTVFYGP